MTKSIARPATATPAAPVVARPRRRPAARAAGAVPDDLPEAGPNRLYGERRLAPSAVIDRARVTVNLAESPLGWLVRRGMVSARQFEAGERLRGDFDRARLAPRTTMSWDAGSSGRTARGAPGAVDPSTAQLSAKGRFEAAVVGVGRGLTDILWRVLCNGEGLEAAERASRWPPRTGKVVLLLALDRLADHYQLA
ncbi:MAG: DUF6456 domain-containing protein [Janthinobacterium lividum]